MDITVTLSEKVVHRDADNLYQTKEIGFTLTESNVPSDKSRDVIFELRLKVKKLIVQTKVLEGLMSAADAKVEVERYEALSCQNK